MSSKLHRNHSAFLEDIVLSFLSHFSKCILCCSSYQSHHYGWGLWVVTFFVWIFLKWASPEQGFWWILLRSLFSFKFYCFFRYRVILLHLRNQSYLISILLGKPVVCNDSCGSKQVLCISIIVHRTSKYRQPYFFFFFFCNTDEKYLRN